MDNDKSVDDELLHIVNEIANKKLVEQIAYKINRTEDIDNLNDLIQDTYMLLLTKNKQKTINLYKKNQLNFFITRVLMNNICSNTSPYYIKYKKRNADRIDDLSITSFNKLKYD